MNICFYRKDQINAKKRNEGSKNSNNNPLCITWKSGKPGIYRFGEIYKYCFKN
jgi:hypothetical protein